jgi:hypothetical protein
MCNHVGICPTGSNNPARLWYPERRTRPRRFDPGPFHLEGFRFAEHGLTKSAPFPAQSLDDFESLLWCQAFDHVIHICLPLSLLAEAAARGTLLVRGRLYKRFDFNPPGHGPGQLVAVAGPARSAPLTLLQGGEDSAFSGLTTLAWDSLPRPRTISYIGWSVSHYS